MRNNDDFALRVETFTFKVQKECNGLFTLHGRGTGNGKNGLLYIMLYCSHCTGNGTGKLYNGLWTHFSVPDLCPGDVL